MPGVAPAAHADILTTQERAWLAAHPVIRLAPDPDFPPIEYLDENGQYQGIAADYTRRVEEILGINIQIERLGTWKEVLAAAEARNIDMFGAASETPQRREYMRFTSPHIELPGVIIVRKDVARDLSMKDLQGLRVAVVAGYVWQDHLTNDYPELELDLVPDVSTGLKKVSFGLADVMIGNLATATYYMQQEGITNLRIAGETGYFGRYAFGVRADWPELATILQKAIDTIEPAERQAILKRWVAFERSSWIPDTRFFIVAGLLLGLFVIGSILYWNFSLKRTVRSRTAELDQELSERRRIEQALSISEQALRQVFDSVYDAIIIHDLTGAILDVNQRMLEMFGITRDEARHLTIEKDLSEPSGQLERLPEIWQRASEGTPLLFEWKVRRPHDHTSLDVEIYLQRISLSTGEVMLATIRDISDRKKIETLKNEFISTVSHELRTPLTSILGSLGLLRGGQAGELSEMAQQLLDLAQRNSQRLLHLINDILDIEKLEAGKTVFNFQTADLVELVQTAVDLNRGFAQNLQVSLRFHTDLDTAPVCVDSDRLAQVMANLISNAAKFSPKNSTVELTINRLASGFRVAVTDHGPGIPKSFQAAVFDKFTQVDSTDTRQQGGTGLGLSISREIIKQMNGQMGLESTAGQGCTFYFDLTASADAS